MSVCIKSLGQTIKKLRKSMGLNQKDFAKLINTSQQTLSRYESNANVPTLAGLKNIAQVCEVDIKELLETTEYMKDKKDIEKSNNMLVQYLVDANIIDPNMTPEIDKTLIDSVARHLVKIFGK